MSSGKCIALENKNKVQSNYLSIYLKYSQKGLQSEPKENKQ